MTRSKMSLHDRVPEGYRRSRACKGLLKPTATTLKNQRIAAENRDLKAQTEALKAEFEAMKARFADATD
jgi:hypothetical protein